MQHLKLQSTPLVAFDQKPKCQLHKLRDLAVPMDIFFSFSIPFLSLIRSAFLSSTDLFGNAVGLPNTAVFSVL